MSYSVIKEKKQVGVYEDANPAPTPPKRMCEMAPTIAASHRPNGLASERFVARRTSKIWISKGKNPSLPRTKGLRDGARCYSTF